MSESRAGWLAATPPREIGGLDMRRERFPLDCMDAELLAALLEQRDRFTAKFGRDPRPEDPVFFDPNADQPRRLDEPAARAQFTAAMKTAGLDPAKIHAFERTGLLVTQPNLPNLSDDDLAEWEAAIEEYEALCLRRDDSGT
jgi:hypothetical protein